MDVEKRTTLPKMQMVCMMCLVVAEVMSLEIIFTIAPFMVQSFDIIQNNEVGYWAGLLAGSYGFTRLFGTPIWGWVSDRVGRRGCILLGAALNPIAMAAFGFSSNIGMAIGLRAVMGVSSGNFGLVRAAMGDMGELYTDDAVGRIWVMYGFAYAIGRSATSAIAGFLSLPCVDIRSFLLHSNDTSLFCRFPFALPALVCSAFMVATLALSFFAMPETARRFRRAKKENALLDLSNSAETSHDANSNSKRSVNVWTRRTLVLMCLQFLFWTMNAMFDDQLSVWAMLPVVNSGLGWVPSDLGWFFLMNGVIVIVVFVWIFPFIMSKLDPRSAFRIGAFLLGPLMFMYIIYQRLWFNTAALWVVLTVGTLAQAVPRNMVAICLGMIINTSVESVVLGHLNGLLEGISAIAKGVGPIFAGSVIAWSVSHNPPFPFNIYLVFFLMWIVNWAILLVAVVFKKDLLPWQQQSN